MRRRRRRLGIDWRTFRSLSTLTTVATRIYWRGRWTPFVWVESLVARR